MVSSIFLCNFAIANEAKDCLKSIAQVAELVDALVSKTNEVTLVPVRSRPRVLREGRNFFSFFYTIIQLFISPTLTFYTSPNTTF